MYVISDKSIFFWIINTQIKIKAIDTSYEIVCATPRRAPSNEYLEFEHHPARNVEYTFILDTHRKYRIPKFMYIEGLECGKIAHNIKHKIKLIIGANVNSNVLARVGYVCSFKKSLIASAKG